MRALLPLAWLVAAPLLGLLGSGCGGEPAGDVAPPAVAPPTPPPATPTAPPPEASPAMDGRCTFRSDDNESSYVYEAGRLVRSTESFDHRSTTFSYEGDRLVGVERRSPERLYFTLRVEYGDDGRVTTVSKREPELDEIVDVERRTFEYDPAGLLVRVTAVEARGGGSSETRFTYDAQGRLAQETSRSGDLDEEDTTRYRYDASGRVASVAAPFQTFDFERDAVGHVARMTMRDDDGELLAVHELTVDGSGRLAARRVRQGSRVSEERFTYDGHFGSGVECGDIARPPGIPASETFQWLGISP